MPTTERAAVQSAVPTLFQSHTENARDAASIGRFHRELMFEVSIDQLGKWWVNGQPYEEVYFRAK